MAWSHETQHHGWRSRCVTTTVTAEDVAPPGTSCVSASSDAPTRANNDGNGTTVSGIGTMGLT